MLSWLDDNAVFAKIGIAFGYNLLQVGIPCGFLLADLTVVVAEFGFERIFPSETDFN
ncbi:hypothetical protein PPBDW_p0055 (plasmid) [Photobacterium kishitanii]|nr:hypothetical protein PPBDW_p0055 [Photobacterium kishitanii]